MPLDVRRLLIPAHRLAMNGVLKSLHELLQLDDLPLEPLQPFLVRPFERPLSAT